MVTGSPDGIWEVIPNDDGTSYLKDIGTGSYVGTFGDSMFLSSSIDGAIKWNITLVSNDKYYITAPSGDCLKLVSNYLDYFGVGSSCSNSAKFKFESVDIVNSGYT